MYYVLFIGFVALLFYLAITIREQLKKGQEKMINEEIKSNKVTFNCKHLFSKTIIK